VIVLWGIVAAPGMPGMDMGNSGSPAASALAGLPLFSAVASLHVLRLLSAEQLPDADRCEDAGHLAMGAGMTVMVFPGAGGGLLHTLGVVFAVLAILFFARALYHRASPGHRIQSAAIGTGQSAMAYMLAAPAHPPAWLPATVAGALAMCTLVHGRRLIDARYGATGNTAPATSRLLVTLPHTGTLVTTAAMAWMVAAA
jgi:hypothetical protein